MSVNNTIPDESLYNPQLFEVGDLDEAKGIILTAEPGTTTEERWKNETTFLAEQIGEILGPSEDTCILDYGCGVGRLGKTLIEKYGCWVLGVDISLSMRQLAPGYVRSERFSVCSPETLDMLVERGFVVDHAISVWVLQHCMNPISDIFRIKGALKSKGYLYVLNNTKRAVPTDRGWADDGIDIEELLQRQFHSVLRSSLPESITTSEITQKTFISLFQNQ